MIVYEHTTSVFIIGLAVIVALSVFVISVWKYIPLTPLNLPVIFMRVFVLLILAWCLFIPSRRNVEIRTLKPRFIVALDTSESMMLSPSVEHSNRWSQAVATIDLPWLNAMSMKCNIDAFQIAEELGPRMSISAVSNLVPRASMTYLRDSLAKLSKSYTGQNVTGVLLLSDGLDTREATDDWAVGPWPWPIYTASFEHPDAWEKEPDIRIEAVNTPRRVVVGWQSELQAIISGQGARGQAINVRLNKDGIAIEKQPVQLPQTGGSREITFAMNHPEEGTFTYSVTAPPLPGETRTNDNIYVVSIQVIDARNQLLYVEGLPRWESKYLSRALKASDQVTPLVFIRGPDQKFMTIGQRGDITPDMTPSDLAKFKIVVIGNLSADEIGERRAQNLVTFVDNGGSLVFLGGDKGWGPNGFLKTPLKPVIPIQGHEQTIVEGKYPISLTAIGRSHPAFAGDDALWDALPSVLSYVPGSVPSAIAETLVVVEDESGPHPLIAVQRYGQGKVLAIMTDSLWRWSLGSVQPGGTPYQRFWEQLLAWLLPTEATVNEYNIDVLADHEEAFLGERIEFSARLGKAYPEDVESVVCHVTRPSGRILPFQMAAGRIPAAGSSSFPGYASHYDAEVPGLHKITVEVNSRGQKHESEELAFYVKAHTPESVPRPANGDVLRSLSRSSGGRHFENPRELNEMLRELKVVTEEEESVEYASLWQTPLVICCLIGLLAVEWIVRRLRNLP